MTSPIIIALDLNPKDAISFARELNPKECKVKVGSQLFTSGGPKVIESLRDLGFDIFLDLKFHDIPNTVNKAIKSSLDLGVWMLNVHALGGRDMLIAARESLEGSNINRPLLIGVTLLTSLNDSYAKEMGFSYSIEDQVLKLANLCKDTGLDGVVCSPKELSLLRKEFGEGFVLVTPGIRSSINSNHDQKRTSTASEALSKGANYLVIGREVTLSKKPSEKVKQILETI